MKVNIGAGKKVPGRGPEPAPLCCYDRRRRFRENRIDQPKAKGKLDLTGGFRALSFQFPDSGESGLLAWGRSKRVSAMTYKVITLEFVVPTVLAIMLGIGLSICAVYLVDGYLVPIDKAEAHYPVRGSD
jgi:hypothetical protein